MLQVIGLQIQQYKNLAKENKMTTITGQTKTTPTTHQNVSGTSDTIGFFPYAWPEYDMVKPGWSVVQIPGSTVVSVDGTYHVITISGGNFTSGSSYTFTGKTGLRVTGGLRLVGSDPVVSSSFTILETDFTASGYQGPGITDFGGSIGLLSSGTDTAATAQYGIERTNLSSPKLTEILAYFAGNSLVTDGSLGYNFTVAGTGGASNITKIVLGLDATNFIIAPVDPANPNFTTDGGLLVNIVNANGILAFPVTFTLDSPLITHPGNWW